MNTLVGLVLCFHWFVARARSLSLLSKKRAGEILLIMPVLSYLVLTNLSHLYRNMPESAFIREIVGSCNTWIKKCVSINVIFGYKGGQGYLISTKKTQNNYSFNWANDESFWSQNKVTSPGMRTLKNSCNNGNRSARSVFVVSWNLLLTRAGVFFLSAWNIYSVLTSANNKS